MNLACLNDIITDNLAIHIDLTDIKSWNLNTGLTAFSLTKWSGAISDNINLIDFGLTGFDNGRMDAMWTGITITPSDTLFSMYRIGYNLVQNPTTGQTSGITVTTQFLPMSATSATGGSMNYFDLDGGYLQGFFKLKGFNYELLPARYNNGITIETLVYLYPDSHGIFYMMGARAEDKYNPYFSGETITGTSTTGVNTSFDNYLDAIKETQTRLPAFANPEIQYTTTFTTPDPLDNIKNNAIAFELTSDKHLGYKYINNDGSIVRNISPAVINNTGFTMIAISFMPDEIIDDPDLIECYKQRKGKLVFYINGRSKWTIFDFPEFFCRGFDNDKEKQEGVPYSISWGGGSFGLKHSWHYDYQTYGLYTGQDDTFIDDNYVVRDELDLTDLNGLSLSADTTSFIVSGSSYPVMSIRYTGTTGTSNAYFVKFNNPISVLSNRDYTVDLSIFNNGFFNLIDASGNTVHNKISVVTYGSVDVDILGETEYIYPLNGADLFELNSLGTFPYPDRQEYQYIKDGIMYYGVSGLPVINAFAFLFGYEETNPITGQVAQNAIISGENSWLPMKTTFRTADNSGQQLMYVGLLVETDYEFNSGGTLFVTNFTYTGADILVQDERKDNLLIGQNFDEGFVGGLQKLRIYDKALSSSEILFNALMESENNPALNLRVTKGGRIIYR